MTELSFECPLCDDYFTERYFIRHLLADHKPEETADQLAYIVISNAKEEMLTV